MSSSIFPFPHFVFLFAIRIPWCLSNPDWYTSCNTTHFVCGDIAVGFPFWGNDRPEFCGIPGLELKCENDTPTIKINDVKYRVLEIEEQSQSLRIAREDFRNGVCHPLLINTTLDPQLFDYASGYMNLTIIYGCPIAAILGFPSLFNCPISGSENGYVLSDAVGPGLCYHSVFVPVSEFDWATVMLNLSALEESLKQGFQVKWKLDNTGCSNCVQSRGVCGYDLVSKDTTCYCQGQTLAAKTCTSSPDTAPANPGMHT